MRRLMVFLLIGAVGCGRKGDAEEAPDAARAPAEVAPAPVLTWGLTGQEVRYAEGDLTLLAGVAKPTQDLPEQVWLGVSARKPDGTVVDGPLLSSAPADLESTVTVTHAFGPGFTEVAMGLWAVDPSCPEASEEPCPNRLEKLGDALATWPAEGVAKLDRSIEVAFVKAGADSEVVRVGTAAVLQTVASRYPADDGYTTSAAGTEPGDPADSVVIRHRDLSDAALAEAVAAELRTAIEGGEIGVAHAPDLAPELEVVFGGDGTMIHGYKVKSQPVQMVRPGLSKRTMKRVDEMGQP